MAHGLKTTLASSCCIHLVNYCAEELQLLNDRTLDAFQRNRRNATSNSCRRRYNDATDVVIKEYPALQSLKIVGSNLGSVGEQRHHDEVLKTTKETRVYVDLPSKLSRGKARPTTQFMMRTLARLFDRGPSFKHSFYFLKELRLGRDCLNTSLDVIDYRTDSKGRSPPAAHPAIRMMSGIARSCPSLEVIDFSGVLSLSPESLVYLFFRDAFETLHKVNKCEKPRSLPYIR